jgi:flagellar biosynthesis protein FlhB
MGKIYAAPEPFKKPDYAQYQDFNKYQVACDKYIENIKAWAKSQNPTCPESGKEITFSVADGRARYIVVSLKPVTLIHDDTMDAYSYQYAHRLTAADVRAEVKKLEGQNKLLGRMKLL